MLSPERLRAQGFFDPAAVTRLIDTHVARRDDLSRQIWGLLMFSLWHERYLAGTAPEAGRPQTAHGELRTRS
jgi:asparagine synthase (glutamine-hydrolysing)